MIPLGLISIEPVGPTKIDPVETNIDLKGYAIDPMSENKLVVWRPALITKLDPVEDNTLFPIAIEWLSWSWIDPAKLCTEEGIFTVVKINKK